MESNNYKYTVIKIGFKIRSSHNGVDQTLRFVGPILPKNFTLIIRKVCIRVPYRNPNANLYLLSRNSTDQHDNEESRHVRRSRHCLYARYHNTQPSSSTAKADLPGSSACAVARR